MIARDGACTSIWQDSIEPYQPANQADTAKTYDVAIIGGGITGLSTAWLLQKAGKQCILLEAKNIGFGTTGGTTAHINTVLDTPYYTMEKNFGEDNAKLVAQAAQDAISLIKQNISDLNIDCAFQEKDGYTFAETEEQARELDKMYESCRKVGVDISYTDKIPVPVAHIKAVRFGGQAQFHPLHYVYGLAKAFENAGGVIVENTRVRNVEGDDILEITGDETHTAKAVVFATHIPIGINLLHLRCIPYRTYAMAVRLKHNPDYPRALVYDSQDPYHYYRTQEINGQPYLIGGGCDHRTASEENTEKCFLQLEAHLRKYFDIEEVGYAWSSQYFEPADGLPYIGHLPGHPANVLVATGFGGNGMIYSSVAAITLTDMLTGRETPYIKLFDPNRVKPIAGFVNFIKHNTTVAGEIISKIWPADKLHVLAELAPGDSKVVKYEDDTIALHKDEHGNLHALHSECTHMKCTIAWNAAENSWDCPCHGARFSVNGEVLTGPASTDLERIMLGR
jgi:glycine/D-amino acid oxidase-like deaminating enzyme/nitrite reductase/ring-hydroxylating ferredoxin subunit